MKEWNPSPPHQKWSKSACPKDWKVKDLISFCIAHEPFSLIKQMHIISVLWNDFNGWWCKQCANMLANYYRRFISTDWPKKFIPDHNITDNEPHLTTVFPKKSRIVNSVFWAIWKIVGFPFFLERLQNLRGFLRHLRPRTKLIFKEK